MHGGEVKTAANCLPLCYRGHPFLHAVQDFAQEVGARKR
jgi:hypothetical protein